jgi:hypothetical protein
MLDAGATFLVYDFGGNMSAFDSSPILELVAWRYRTNSV